MYLPCALLDGQRKLDSRQGQTEAEGLRAQQTPAPAVRQPSQLCPRCRMELREVFLCQRPLEQRRRRPSVALEPSLLDLHPDLERQQAPSLLLPEAEDQRQVQLRWQVGEQVRAEEPAGLSQLSTPHYGDL